MLLTEIKNHSAIATYLNESQDIINLAAFSKQLKEQQFYLPIVGQFSAGKSHLINNLLGQDLLPSLQAETTAILTFISYGPAQASVELASGKEVVITLAEIKDLHHHNLESDPIFSEKLGNERITRLNITLEHELLKPGLVIVDTPGVNTIVNDHEMFTQEILPETLALIYVFDKAPSAVDIKLLDKIQQFGINTTFVRTKIDLIHRHEESIDECEQIEQGILQKHLNRKQLAYFAVSNEVNQGWQDRMLSLYDYVLYDISFQSKELIEKGISNKLNQLSDKYQQQLRLKLVRESQLSKSSAEEIKNKLAQVKSSERSFQRKCKSIEEKISSATQQNKSNIERIILANKNTVQASFASLIKGLGSVEQISKSSPELAHQQTELLINNIAVQSQQEIDKWIDGVYADYAVEVEALSEELKNLTHLEFSIPLSELGSHTLEIGRYQSVLDELEHLADIQKKSENELQQLGISSNDLLATQAHLKEHVAQIQQEQSALGQYQPHYIDIPGDKTVSHMCKQVGALADIALMFTPIAPLEAVAGGAKAGKVIQGASKAQKTMQQVTKGVQQVAIGAQQVKRFKDQNQHNPLIQQAEQTGIFDLLTLEFYFKKIGENFDTPSRKTLDLEHQAHFQQEESRVNAIYQAHVEKELTIRHEIESFTSRQEKEAMRLELTQKKQQAKQQELQLIKQKTEQDTLKKYQQQCVELFNQSLNSPVGELEQVINKHIAEIHNDLVTASTKDIVTELVKIEKEISQYASNNDALSTAEVEIEKINTFINQLSQQVAICA